MKKITQVIIPLIFLSFFGAQAAPKAISAQDFQHISTALSEDGGFFDTDNLITNESSYQHVVPWVRKLPRQQGAYMGVGPGQNFTYIAQLRPKIALIVDVRRDNLLLMLYYKLLFEKSRNRWEFLSNLLGKPLPRDFQPDLSVDIWPLLDRFRTTDSDSEFFQLQFSQVWRELKQRFPQMVDSSDRKKLFKMAREFFDWNLLLKFRSHGRPPRTYYPTLERLMLETDAAGNRWHYLNREEDFQFLRQMQVRNLIIPVICDLAGESSLRSVGKFFRQHNLQVSLLYVSNVEFYLFRQGRFGRFLDNLKSLPLDAEGLFIRSYFSYGFRHPDAVPGYFVTSLAQKFARFFDEHKSRNFVDYWDLVTRNHLPVTLTEN